MQVLKFEEINGSRIESNVKWCHWKMHRIHFLHNFWCIKYVMWFTRLVWTSLEAKEWNKKYTSIIEKLLHSYFFLLKQNDFQKAILEPIVDTKMILKIWGLGIILNLFKDQKHYDLYLIRYVSMFYFNFRLNVRSKSANLNGIQ